MLIAKKLHRRCPLNVNTPLMETAQMILEQQHLALHQVHHGRAMEEGNYIYSYENMVAGKSSDTDKGEISHVLVSKIAWYLAYRRTDMT